jgi:hypothetical protein
MGKLDGCSRKAGEIVGGDLLNRPASSLSREEAAELLSRARAASEPVAPHRLGKVGRLEQYEGYFKADGTFERDGAKIPFVVEAWANVTHEEPRIVVCVNRSAIVADTTIGRYNLDKTRYAFHGCNLHTLAKVNRNRAFFFLLNVQCPFMPITNDGKAPDFHPIKLQLLQVLEGAARGAASRTKGQVSDKKSQKTVILDALDAAIEKVSGGGRHRYSQRQLFYAVRPGFINAFGQEPKWKTFCAVITQRERELGHDLPRIYRDSRGTLYHPHTGEEIALGTLAVEQYERPAWTFNKILYCEKEGFFPLLKDSKWPEKNDCALLTSKGFATRAVCDVLDLLGETDEPLTFFCVHDADGPGTTIFEAMQEGAGARPARKPKIINLGLEPEDALEMGLEPENVERKKKTNGKLMRVPVGRYVSERWRAWLQKQRVELNAMTTPQFLEWLDRKIAPHHKGKVLPPLKVMRERLEADVRQKARATITEEILRQANIDGRLEEEMGRLRKDIRARAAKLPAEVRDALARKPEESWSLTLQRIAAEVIQGADMT